MLPRSAHMPCMQEHQVLVPKVWEWACNNAGVAHKPGERSPHESWERQGGRVAEEVESI